MSRPRYAFLNASYDDENTPRNFRRELDADLAEFDVNEGNVPADYAFDAVVVTGSRASVYWDEPWLPPLKGWVAEAVERGLPVLGVCFGHQLVADVLGGTVEAMDRMELGYHEIDQVAGDRLFDDVPDPFVSFTTHSDAVTALPPGAKLLAENEFGVQAFRNDRAYGVQFHPEYDPETARAITRGKDLPGERIQSVLDGITDEAYDRAMRTKAVFDNFEAFAAEFDAPADTVRDADARGADADAGTRAE